MVRNFVLPAGACVALAACSGGGSTGTPSTSIFPNSVHQIASGTLMIIVPGSQTAGKVRKPAYVSPSTTYVTLWIDAAATGNRVACSPGSLHTCTLNWTSTSGSHTFAVAIDDSPSVTGGGNVLAEASSVENLVEGENTLSTITLNGVPAQITFHSESYFSGNSSQCTSVGITFDDCYYVSALVEDADGNTLVPPGRYDNGGICFNPNGEGEMGNSNCVSGLISGTFVDYQVACQPLNGTWTFTVVASAKGSAPYGEISAAQLASYNLQYPNQASLTMNDFPTYSCEFGVFS